MAGTRGGVFPVIGKTLAHYRIVGKIGAGWMGEVYRAEDTTLKREVAIKVLPEQFTQEPQPTHDQSHVMGTYRGCTGAEAGKAAPGQGLDRIGIITINLYM